MLNPVLAWINRTLGRHAPAVSVMPGALRATPALCPRCRGHVRRVPRHLVDRLVGCVVAVHRYRCQAIGCSWDGRRVVHQNDASRRQRIYDATATVLEPSRLSDSAAQPVSGPRPK
jgi:hypothetical protein